VVRVVDSWNAEQGTVTGLRARLWLTAVGPAPPHARRTAVSDDALDPEDYDDPFERLLEARVEAARQRASLQSLAECEECESEIPPARRKAIAGVRLCVECQNAADRFGALRAG